MPNQTLPQKGVEIVNNAPTETRVKGLAGGTLYFGPRLQQGPPERAVSPEDTIRRRLTTAGQSISTETQVTALAAALGNTPSGLK